MDTIEAINRRRSIKRYLDRPVEFEKITTLIDAARKAPSAGNLQDWNFIIVSEKDLVKQASQYCVDQYWIQTAPILIIVCALPEKHEMYYGLRGKRLYNIQDCAAAIQNILLAATDMGLGTCWIGAFEEEKIRTLFAIPQDVRPQAIITVGYSDETPQEKTLQHIENITFFNRYGMKIERLHIVLRDYSVEWKRQGGKIRQGIKHLGESIKSLSSRLRKKKKN
jgi:nitroreductase